MARFTVADCMECVDNRFLMTIIASMRAREIEETNSTHLNNTENDKSAVLSLREIADNLVSMDILSNIE